jgi:sodium-coupled neutral amino acid transporter 11
MFTTLPLELFVCREVHLLVGNSSTVRLTAWQVIEQYFFPHEPFSLQRHVFFTTTILVSSMLGKVANSLVGPLSDVRVEVALLTCDLGVMLEITGGVSATALAFIFPAACFAKLTPGKWHSRAKWPALLCVIFGVVVMLISLVIALGKAWTHQGDPRICT